MKKACVKCGLKKEVNEINFRKEKFNIDGYGNTCKACKSESDKKRYEEKKKDKVFYQF